MPSSKSSNNALARRVVRDAAAAAVFRSARKYPPRAPAPRGMGGHRGLYTTQDDAVTLDRIPVKRAVRVGKQWWNGKTLRTLLHRDQVATNPLTRQPFPAAVTRKYAPKSADLTVLGPAIGEVNRLWRAYRAGGPAGGPANMAAVARSMRWRVETWPGGSAASKRFRAFEVTVDNDGGDFEISLAHHRTRARVPAHDEYDVVWGYPGQWEFAEDADYDETQNRYRAHIQKAILAQMARHAWPRR